MQYRQLGKSGVKVSSLCLGAMTFGEANAESFMHQVGCDEAVSFDILNAAVAAGINFIDTADVYGQEGLSERIIGRWFSKCHKRNDVVLATKFRFSMGSGPNASGASRYRIIRCVEDSLRRLQTDRIDLYQIHMQDIDTPEEETMRALDDLVRSGKVLYVGASNYAAYRLADSAWISRAHHLHHFVTLQAQYSLVVRELEREHIPACERFGPRRAAMVAFGRRVFERQIQPERAGPPGQPPAQVARAICAVRHRPQLGRGGDTQKTRDRLGTLTRRSGHGLAAAQTVRQFGHFRSSLGAAAER